MTEPLPEKRLDLRALGSAIVAAIEEHVGEYGENWSIIIQDVDPNLIRGRSGVRSSYRDTHREIILVLERGNITLISKRFEVKVCQLCGAGRI